MDKTGWVLASCAVGLLLWRGRWRKTNVLLGIGAASATIAVGSGAALELSKRVAAAVAVLSGKLSVGLFGVDLPWLLAVILIGIVVFDIWRGATATNMTVLLAVVAVFSMGSIPGTFGEQARSLAGAIGSTVTAVFAAFLS